MQLIRLVIVAAALLPYSMRTEAEPTAPQDGEWIVTLGCRHCHFGELTGLTTCKGNCGPAALQDGKVTVLTGAAVPKDFKKGGQWLVKGTLSADAKTIAVKEMTARELPTGDAKDEKPAATSPDAKSFTGPVSRTGAGLPTLTAPDQTRYGLKPSKTASASTRATLTRIGGGEATGTFTAVGATYEDDTRKWVVVDSIRAEDRTKP